MTAAGIAELAVGVIVALVASSGFWAFVMYRQQKKDSESEDMKAIKDALRGILFSDIIEQGEKYIQRNNITLKELEEFERYCFNPYRKLNGNGLAEEIWESLKDLPHNDEG